MEAIGSEPRLMPHLHLSLQAGDDLVLKRMKRRHGRADAVAFCASVRAARPDAVFGADLIAGFPTETEAMFARSLALVEDCGLTWLHVFPFSPRAGTPAARMPQVPPAVARERAERLRAAGAAAVAQHFAAMAGARVRLLMERPDFGRTEGFAPVRLAAGAEPGAIVEARVTGAGADALIAEAA
jgi:threonylcarbamoyladenosine tRNA methylthiotransferase MtaB